MATSATDVGMSGSQEIRIRPECVQTVNLLIGISLEKRRWNKMLNTDKVNKEIENMEKANINLDENLLIARFMADVENPLLVFTRLLKVKRIIEG